MSSRLELPDVVAHGLVDRGEVHGPGVAVEQRRAVEEEARGEGAEQEVLERGLLAQQATATGEAAQQVEREREHLEADEHRQQVVGRGEQHHPEDREHHERVDLGVLAVGRDRRGLRVGAGHRGRLAGEGRDASVEVALGEQQHAGDRQRQHESPDEQARSVDGNRPAHREDTARGALVVRLDVTSHEHDADQGADETEEGHRDLGGVAHRARREGLDDDSEAGDAEDRQQGPELEVLDARLHELGHWGPPSWPMPTLASESWTNGLMTSSSGIG